MQLTSAQNAAAIQREEAFRLVVVIDSDPAVRNALVFALQVEGFNACAYASGEELLASEWWTACCFVVDEWPDGQLSGRETIASLQAAGVMEPVLLMTTARSRPAPAGNVRVVEKPLLGAVFTNAVRDALEQARAA